MRGAQVQPGIRDGAVGIIPADAGSTKHGVEVFGAMEDHPRGCGEHT